MIDRTFADRSNCSRRDSVLAVVMSMAPLKHAVQDVVRCYASSAFSFIQSETLRKDCKEGHDRFEGKLPIRRQEHAGGSRCYDGQNDSADEHSQHGPKPTRD